MRIVVIGGTASGTAAAAEAVRANPEAEVVLYEQEPHIAVGACEIPYMVGGWIDDWRRLEVMTPRQFEQSKGGKVRERHRVTSIDARKKSITIEALDFGSVHEDRYDRLILATGARPRRLDIEGEDAPNVFHIRTLETARRLRAWLDNERVRHVVMVGGGYVGVEMAETLRSRGIRVSILEPVGRVLGASLSESGGRIFDDHVRQQGVVVRQEAPVRFETGPGGRVRAVHTDKKEIIGCDLVCISVGLTQNTEVASGAGVRVGNLGGIVVDEGMRTSVSNVFACGDVIEVPHVASRAPVYRPLAPVGRRSARVAARNAASRGAGLQARLAPVVRILGVSAFGMEAAMVGLNEKEARAAGFDVMATEIRYWSRAFLYPGAKRLQVRLLVERGTGRLLGGELVGEEGAGLRANVLVPLIREGYTARQVTEEIDFLYNPPIAPAVDPLMIACSKAARTAERSTRQR